jgi:hypothetical protein
MNVNQDPSYPHHDRFRLGLFSCGLYIGRGWRPAAGDGRIQVIDPSTETVLVAVPMRMSQMRRRPRRLPQARRKAGARRRRENVSRSSAAVSNSWSNALKRRHAHIAREREGLARRARRVAYVAELFRWNAQEAMRISGGFGMPRPVRTGLSSTTSQSVSAFSSCRGTSPPPWRRERSRQPLPRARDIGRGMRVASKIEAGVIAPNRGLVPISSPALAD